MLTDDLLARTSAIGPYFAVGTGPREDAAGFVPLARLYADPALLAGAAADVGRRMGTGDVRVAASTLQLGLASRLWSVALGTAALAGRVPDLSPERLWWRAVTSGPLALWLVDPVAAVPGDPADTLHEVVVEGHLTPLAAEMRRVFRLSPQVLRGNAASALVGTLRVLHAQLPHPDFPPLPWARALLDREPLAGTGRLSTRGGEVVAFRRRSCCLYYRVGGGVCGDCVLDRSTA